MWRVQRTQPTFSRTRLPLRYSCWCAGRICMKFILLCVTELRPYGCLYFQDEAEIKEVEGHISDEKTEPGSAQGNVASCHPLLERKDTITM